MAALGNSSSSYSEDAEGQSFSPIASSAEVIHPAGACSHGKATVQGKMAPSPQEYRPGMSPVHISIVTAIGAFSVSALSIFLGYKLFIAGATGAFQFSVESGKAKASLLSVAPGLGFAAFGMGIAIYALKRLIGVSK